MENLRYSGRGRQGRGRFASGKGYARGRGRGRGASSWTRPRDDDSCSTHKSESSTWSQNSSVSSSRGPILSGPRNHGHFGGISRGRGRSAVVGRGRGRGRMSYNSFHSSQSWRRDTVDAGQADDGGLASQDNGQKEPSKASEVIRDRNLPSQKEPSKASEVIRGPNLPGDMNRAKETTEEDNQDSIPELIKVGKNKLVLPSSSKPQSEEGRISPHNGSLLKESKQEGREMIAKGRNKLVLSKTTSSKPFPNHVGTQMIPKKNNLVLANNKNNHLEPGSGMVLNHDTTKMVAKGSNKLVSQKNSDYEQMNSGNGQYEKSYSSNNAWKKSSPKYNPQQKGPILPATAPSSNNAWKKSQPSYNPQRKRPKSPIRSPIIKRVKIGGAEGTGASQEGESNSDDGSQGKNKETLTDFCYRETSLKSTQGGHISTGGGRRQPPRQNMGLVRVNPDKSKTRICPTFLRGRSCEDERCTKRHDVPREFAMPVCSFFNRRGQCLKGDECPFRHVKVNPLAMPCPSFNMLGYCDDNQCVMQHLPSNNKSLYCRKTNR